ncbi:MAG: type IV pilus modification PilV family protein [Gemmatimonadaceae bacterium]
MSLLESLVSLVILAIAAVSFLGTFQQSARAVRDAELWLRGTHIVETAMEARKAGADVPPNDSSFVTTVAEQPVAPGLIDVEVAVQLPDGQRLIVHRIIPQ